MVKKPFKGKYLELKVRVSYDENSDTIHLTSKDKDLPTTRGFHLTLNKGRDAEYTLRSLLENEGLIPEDRFKTIPEKLSFDDAINIDKWDQFPLGRYSTGEETIWNPSSHPHLLISGTTGSGKSVILRNILFHCLRHPQDWVVKAVDFHKVELSSYMQYGNPNNEVVTTLTEAAALVQNAYNEMFNRYYLMEKKEVNNFRDLPDAPPAWMVLLDAVSLLLPQNDSTSPVSLEENVLKEDIKANLDKIAMLGRAAGIQLVMTNQVIDPDMFDGHFMSNITTRIATGRMSEEQSTTLLHNSEAAHLNGAIRGRGYFQSSGVGADFQGYFSSQNWPEEAGIVSKDQ